MNFEYSEETKWKLNQIHPDDYAVLEGVKKAFLKSAEEIIKEYEETNPSEFSEKKKLDIFDAIEIFQSKKRYQNGIQILQPVQTYHAGNIPKWQESCQDT